MAAFRKMSCGGFAWGDLVGSSATVGNDQGWYHLLECEIDFENIRFKGKGISETESDMPLMKN